MPEKARKKIWPNHEMKMGVPPPRNTGTQKPKSMFPFVKFMFSHCGIRVRGGGGVSPPPPTPPPPPRTC